MNIRLLLIALSAFIVSAAPLKAGEISLKCKDIDGKTFRLDISDQRVVMDGTQQLAENIVIGTGYVTFDWNPHILGQMRKFKFDRTTGIWTQETLDGKLVVKSICESA